MSGAASSRTQPQPAGAPRRAPRHDDSLRNAVVPILLALLLTAVSLLLPVPSRTDGTAVVGGSPEITVIVRGVPGAEVPGEDVAALGGLIVRPVDLLDGFIARIPATATDELAALPGVAGVTPDAPVRLHSAAYDPATHPGSLVSATEATGARRFWEAGHTGAGVDVALIDSGVVPVNGLSAEDKIVFGPDLSLESQNPNLRYLDTYGHGTHMAGIIAGRENGTAASASDTSSFLGVAPDARIVSVKVAGHNGATDVSQVIAAIDWVVQHQSDPGINIRVLNLAFGTDGSNDYRYDPLAYAAENAWHAGVVVVVSAGNRDFGDATLNNPAYDPFVIAVGASDHRGTADPADDGVASFSSAGDSSRGPDVVAPGRSVVALRAPGSYIDQQAPQGRVGDRFFAGSGTSQAAAVTAGAAALIVSQRPDATPDQVKALLTSTAQPLADESAGQGAGRIDLDRALDVPTPDSSQTFERATGGGSLDGARGSSRLKDGGKELRGEKDVFGARFDAPGWTKAARNRKAWDAGNWNGNTWTGGAWTTVTTRGSTWTGAAWTTTGWSSASWSSSTWSGSTWTGCSWSNNGWTGSSWSGVWAGSTWGATWSAFTWSSAGWGS